MTIGARYERSGLTSTPAAALVTDFDDVSDDSTPGAHRIPTEDWMIDADALAESALEYEVGDDGVIRANLPDGKSVTMLQRPVLGGGEQTAQSCNVTYWLSTPFSTGASVLGDVGISVSSGCPSGESMIGRLQSRECIPVFGCAWSDYDTETVHAAPGTSWSVYVSGCRQGTHDWRTHSLVPLQSSSTVNLSLSAC